MTAEGGYTPPLEMNFQQLDMIESVETDVL